MKRTKYEDKTKGRTAAVYESIECTQVDTQRSLGLQSWLKNWHWRRFLF
jgi:hypothetical protein